ncbi:MAG TPA: HAD-IIIC family phosphatase [Mycobacteriales bacterium]|nr:HAD-IIIC family phosphatase [Mycobacteriales bacterium]
MTAVPTRLVKVIVWDLDGTLWPGVALESDGLPAPYPAALAALDTLAARGILVSVASRNPAEVGELVERSALAGRFVAAQYGWGRKADALRRIAAELDLKLDALAFVDDDPMERADVERTLPDVTVLAPGEVADALSWPEFDPRPVTAAARSRLASYRQRERRRAARSAFDGSEEDFLRWCELRATLRRAATGDEDRLVELARRTTQYNSTGVEFPAGEAVVLSLADRFGDDGLVGVAAVSTPDGPEWTVDLVAVSCRAGGRGAVPVLLAGVARLARSRGAGRLLVPCRLTERNVPIRLGLKQAGFTAAGRSGDVAVYALDLTAAPAYPGWISVTEQL